MPLCHGSVNRSEVFHPAQLNCDFKNDLCGWVNDKNTEYAFASTLWRQTDDPLVEPGSSHTSLVPFQTVPGSRTWLSTSFDQKSTNVILQSRQPVARNQPLCFTFWYYFSNLYSNSYLKVVLTKWTNVDAETSQIAVLWEIRVPTVYNWQMTQIEVAPQSYDYYFNIIAGSESEQGSLVAGIDDILVLGSTCPTDPMYCDFETNLCGWQVNGMKRVTPHYTVDHSTGTYYGHYLITNSLTESSMRLNLSSISPGNDSDDPVYCFRFYSYLIQHSGGKLDPRDVLRIQQGKVGSTNQSRTLFEIPLADYVYRKSDIYRWNLVKINIYATRDSWLQVSVDLTKSQPYYDLAFDDVSFAKRPCEPIGDCDFENGNFLKIH